MPNIDNSGKNQPGNPLHASDEALKGLAAIAAVVVAAISVSGIFAASAMAGAAVLLAVSVIVLLAVLVARKESKATPALLLLVGAALWAALGGFIVFEAHWLAFTPAAWVLNGLFVAALIAGAWAKLEAWAKALAALLAAALVTATMLLPRPPGGEGPLDTAEKWKIDVDVADKADGAPLEDARVLCATLMQWEQALAPADPAARTTGRDGRAETWEFDEDPRLKIAICTAWKNADDGNAGYPAQTQIVPALAGGGEYRLHFDLDETPHPDITYLALDLTGTFAQHNWFYLTFEVWAGAPQGYVGEREGPQPLARKQWGEMHGGFALRAHEAAGDLTLRYHYEGPASGDGLNPPYNETQTLSLGALAPGTRRRVALSIPAGQGEN